MQNLTGQIIKGYELRQLIGVGGFAAVYRAYQPVVERDVAIKVILSKYANNPEFVRRFETEAQIVARLEHLHIVALYDYWREPNNAFLVMRWLRGGSLYSSIKQKGAWSLQATARLLDQIASALAVAHRHGVIHRDLTPANILLDEEENAYLADFGIAKDIVDSSNEVADDHLYGSPAYMAPERIMRDQPVPQTDIYSLGIVLYEMLTGRLPFDAPTHTTLMRKHLDEPMPPLQEHAPELPAGLNLVILRAAAKSPEARYADALTFAADFRRAIGLADPSLAPSLPADSPPNSTTVDLSEGYHTLILPELVEPQNPYKGLRAFDEADAADFYGREILVEQMLEQLATQGRFLAVVGPSGSGKSSAVRAGLIPALRDGALTGSAHWFIVKMVPGAHPYDQLETALNSVAFNTSINLLETLKASEQGLSTIVQHILPHETDELVLFIDQFEEVFTQVTDEVERSLFLNSLRAAILDPKSRLRVILTLRADFYDRPLLYASFGELIREHTFVILPLTNAELHESVTAPALRAGLKVEDGLAEAIVADVNEQPGALPLLQYALTELFEQRADHTLKLDVYRANGGVMGALARRAETLYQDMNPAYQTAAQQMFLRLVSLGEGTKDTRRRVRWAELISLGRENKEVYQAVLDQFGKYRLLTFDRDPQTREPVVEIAHEAFISQWQRLRDWIEQNRDNLRTQLRLTAAAADWFKGDKDASYLSRGAQLTQYEALDSASLTQTEADYLAASVALRQRAIQRQRLFIAGLIGFSLFALALALFAFDRQNHAEKSQAEAITARDAADQQARISRSRELAATARGQMTQLDRALLLSLEALNVADTFEARDSLLMALRYSPHLRAFLHGHPAGADVRSVAIHDPLIATSDAAGNIMLWDMETRQMVGSPLLGHEGEVNSIAFSPDGQLLVSGGADGRVRLWDVNSGDMLGKPFEGQTAEIWSVAFSPDGTRIAAAGEAMNITLWDVETGEMVFDPLKGHTDYVYSVAFSPDGSLLASGGADNMVRLWDAQTGEALGEPLAGHTNWVWDVAFSPDGRQLASSSYDNRIMIWDVETRTVVGFPLTGHTDWVRGISFSPDGQQLASSSRDNTVIIWDVASGSAVDVSMIGHSDAVWDVAFSADGHTLVSGDGNGSVLMWDTEQAALVQNVLVGHQDEVTDVAFSPDGTQLASVSGTPTGGDDYSLRLWDVNTGQEIAMLLGHEGPLTGVAYSDTLIATASGDGTIVVWDAKTQKAVQTLSAFRGNYPLCLAISGKYIAAGYFDDTIIVWDAETGRPISEPLAGHTDDVVSVTFSPDGSLLASSSWDGTVVLWDAQTWLPLGEPLTGHTGYVVDVAFSPDGKLLASGGEDGSIRLWDVKTRQQNGQPLQGAQDMIYSIAFSPDGQLLVSGGEDRVGQQQTLALWDMTSRQLIGVPLTGHRGRVTGVAFHPNGQLVASSSWDGRVRLWDVSLENWRTQACLMANRNLTEDERLRYFGSAASRPTCP
ncbi:MAG TPA: protein kinase [Aggregatilineaceae bacterium]|nr:protein kinase [Aggregatilineaceae bacterium]